MRAELYIHARKGRNPNTGETSDLKSPVPSLVPLTMRTLFLDVIADMGARSNLLIQCSKSVSWAPVRLGPRFALQAFIHVHQRSPCHTSKTRNLLTALRQSCLAPIHAREEEINVSLGVVMPPRQLQRLTMKPSGTSAPSQLKASPAVSSTPSHQYPMYPQLDYEQGLRRQRQHR